MSLWVFWQKQILFFFLHLLCASLLKVAWCLISQIKQCKVGCKEVARSPSWRIPGWLQTWDSTVAFCILKVWFCLKTFKCSLYVFFSITQSNLHQSIKKVGWWVFLIYVCIKTPKQVLKMLSLQKINMNLTGKYQNVRRNGMYCSMDGMRIKIILLLLGQRTREFLISGCIF